MAIGDRNGRFGAIGFGVNRFDDKVCGDRDDFVSVNDPQGRSSRRAGGLRRTGRGRPRGRRVSSRGDWNGAILGAVWASRRSLVECCGERSKLVSVVEHNVVVVLFRPDVVWGGEWMKRPVGSL